MTAWRRAVAASLGDPPADPPAAESAADVALLGSPTRVLDVGDSCYEGGDPPEGRIAAQRLRARKDLVALRHVLRGVCPEGRVYAVDVMRLLAAEGVALDEADRKTMDAVAALPIKVSFCSGCEVYPVTAAEALAELERARRPPEEDR